MKVVIGVGLKGYKKTQISKKDSGFGRIITRSVSSLIFIKKYAKTKKLE